MFVPYLLELNGLVLVLLGERLVLGHRGGHLRISRERSGGGERDRGKGE